MNMEEKGGSPVTLVRSEGDAVELDMEDMFTFGSRDVSRRNSLNSQCSDSDSVRLVQPGIISRSVSRIEDEEEDGCFDEEEEVRETDSPSMAEGGGEGSGGASSSSSSGAPTKLGSKDFELLRVVGQGAFGKVFQVRLKRTDEIYAMKVLKKSQILEKDHIDYMRVEREILTSVNHPFIVTLYNTFQTSSKLYMVMEFINGGHLFFQLYDQGLFTEDIARFFAAEMVLAVGHLHSLGFVHRDMKPENVLLGADGHLKVTDFGLAKCNMTDEPRTNSMCGTIEYMAPEVILGNGHGKTVDWWSIGILLYEMLVGLPPFRSKNKNTLKKKITRDKIKLPKYLTSEAHSLIKALLQRDPSKRLGYGPSGFEQIKKHPFFKTIHWKKLENLEIPSPFKPVVSGVDCVNNFDKEYTELPPLDSPCGTPDVQSPALKAALKENGDPFKGFTYCEPSLLETFQGLQVKQDSSVELSFTGWARPNGEGANGEAAE
ncbi:serine/threonine-protein kinase [Chloropicon primus]|uniref:non-specific serine/threonine protein kinase n=1 Tax=Chloropicon primus TaxID=1764295 RepID=A0A5B8MR80_9CHLO|nr:serine/threonine-protein kinase [Chloropicon primus]UPR02203.1 serine/threonine-protein kinase [Chloropicon primus]|mmetsp:Transcript_10406/g.29482  ORF Transcript_10406/g.29482 Transcript_10406/m.29482 type:complete len:487 (+) Transcript_10406:217-1677(+)|eukprot:QDZ22986.1 serine/threonine-protein kinase [Chloropicon primus]